MCRGFTEGDEYRRREGGKREGGRERYTGRKFYAKSRRELEIPGGLVTPEESRKRGIEGRYIPVLVSSIST